jgi:hypothetical protein
LARAAVGGWRPTLAASAVWLLAQRNRQRLIDVNAQWDRLIDPKLLAVYAGAISTAAE